MAKQEKTLAEKFALLSAFSTPGTFSSSSAPKETKEEENPLAFLATQSKRVLYKWVHYFDIYHRHFQKFRMMKKPIKMLEIGVAHGGSLELWNNYFGAENIQLTGIDICPGTTVFDTTFPNVKIYLGDQANREFLRKVVKERGPFDIILDDGGHQMDQQIISWEELYPHVNPGGVYMCEDTHTSYWPQSYNGGYQKPGTYMEFAKAQIDGLNHPHHKKGVRDPFLQSMHFYDSVVVYEKAGSEMEMPHAEKWGTERIAGIGF